MPEMWLYFLLGCLLLSCIAFIWREKSKKKNLRKKAQLLSIENDWLIVVHEEGNNNSIVYSYNPAAPGETFHMIESFIINKTYSKKKHVIREIKGSPEEIESITQLIKKTFLLVYKKSEMIREFKRNNTIYLVKLNKQ